MILLVYMNLVCPCVVDITRSTVRKLTTHWLKKVFSSPLTFPQDNLTTLDQSIQLEVLDLQNNSNLKGRFDELPPLPNASDMISFWSMLPPSQFVHLRAFAQRYICRFGSTYRCEQTFSAMTKIKNRNRASLTDIIWIS